MNRAFARLVAAALAAGGGLPAAFAQPSLSHVAPGAISPGKTTEVVLHGAKLDGTLRVWTSFPAQVEMAAGDPKQKDRKEVVCKVTLAAGAPVGIGGIAVSTAAGMSDVVYLMVDDLPSVADSGNNHAAGSPQEIDAANGDRRPVRRHAGRLLPLHGPSGRADFVRSRRCAAGLGLRFADPRARCLGQRVAAGRRRRRAAAPTRDLYSPRPASGQYLLETARQPL